MHDDTLHLPGDRARILEELPHHSRVLGPAPADLAQVSELGDRRLELVGDVARQSPLPLEARFQAREEGVDLLDDDCDLFGRCLHVDPGVEGCHAERPHLSGQPVQRAKTEAQGQLDQPGQRHDQGGAESENRQLHSADPGIELLSLSRDEQRRSPGIGRGRVGTRGPAPARLDSPPCRGTGRNRSGPAGHGARRADARPGSAAWARAEDSGQDSLPGSRRSPRTTGTAQDGSRPRSTTRSTPGWSRPRTRACARPGTRTRPGRPPARSARSAPEPWRGAPGRTPAGARRRRSS